ncbi:hypothetical protein KSC_080080 [Ktedonobacter sp. SOSP1-52]|nr:hypothetical protein KSC_080080 [Ktedonobacter sp. SOSP1-52]
MKHPSCRASQGHLILFCFLALLATRASDKGMCVENGKAVFHTHTLISERRRREGPHMFEN